MIRILFTFLVSLLLTGMVNAQQDHNRPLQSEKRAGEPQLRSFESRDTGDTLFHFDGFYYFVNDSDYSDFEMKFTNLDGHTPHPDNYYESSDWQFYYLELSPGDTLDWVEATSWFKPVGQANDWITFGPVTIPSNGAILTWKDYHNPQFRNGYEVLINIEGMQPENFENDPVYVVEDLYQENSQDIDTNSRFQNPPQQVEIPSAYNDTTVYIAFHHNSEDMDVLHLTDIVLKRKGVGLSNPPVKSLRKVKSYPNPAKEKVTVSFYSEKGRNVRFKLYNMAGVVVRTEEVDVSQPGNHAINMNISELTSGMYFFELTDGYGKSTQKLIVE